MRNEFVPARVTPPGTHRTDIVTDLALTLPSFLVYHLGVAFLPIRNAADVVTSRLAALAEHSQSQYMALTLGLGVFVVLILFVFGHRDKVRWQGFALVVMEGVLYAMAMRFLASYIVGHIPLHGSFALSSAAGVGYGGATSIGIQPEHAPLGDALSQNAFASVIMAFGAGFYEELAFRVVLFGLGAKILLALDDWMPYAVYLLWALLCAGVFSAWHHFGALGEPFTTKAFVFRMVCGLVFTTIFAFRGFAPAVWTHTLYDLWVMVG